jgi:glycosyltransferase involved in cell wall biosynthesis
MVNVSVLILTKNEEANLPGCLASLKWSDDIHVLDSGSIDSTREIATAAGAKVITRPFDNYASQRNYGLGLSFAHRWLLILDADERIPPALASEMIDFVANVASDVAGARLRRRDIWDGCWLKHAQVTPYYVRLVRLGHVHYEREINENLLVDGAIADLCQPFDHFPFSRGIDHWIDRHNVYSHMEAALIAGRSIPKASWRSALLSKDIAERRKHQKAIFYRLPARPLIKFAYMMFIRGAVLDGWPGIRYALLQSIYEYMIVLKTRELTASDENHR